MSTDSAQAAATPINTAKKLSVNHGFISGNIVATRKIKTASGTLFLA